MLCFLACLAISAASRLKLSAPPVGTDLQRRREVMKAVAAKDGWRVLRKYPEQQRDREIVMTAIENDGEALEYAAPELRADREIVKVAMQRSGEALDYASLELRADREIVKLAVTQWGYALVYAAPELRADREIVKLAVANGLVKIWEAAANQGLCGDREVVKQVVANRGGALQWAAPELRADPEIVKLAVVNEGDALRWAARELRADSEVVKLAVANHGESALDYANPRIAMEIEEAAMRLNVRLRDYVVGHDFLVQVLALGPQDGNLNVLCYGLDGEEVATMTLPVEDLEDTLGASTRSYQALVRKVRLKKPTAIPKFVSLRSMRTIEGNNFLHVLREVAQANGSVSLSSSPSQLL